MDDDENALAGTLDDAQTLKTALGDLEIRSRAFGSALTSALTGAAVGGKGLDDVLKGLATRFADIALASGLKPLETLLSGAIGGLAGLGNTGGVTAFADGGIVSQPTYFAMEGGTGLMGEAGTEAVLPLTRGADGALGVAMSGAQASPIVFNVTATDAASFARSEGQISAMLARTVRRGQRNL